MNIINDVITVLPSDERNYTQSQKILNEENITKPPMDMKMNPFEKKGKISLKYRNI